MIARAEIAFDPRVKIEVARGAWVVFSLSGGKDSTAAAFAANEWLDRIGHPRSRRIAIHAHLGAIEWRSTETVLEQVCARLNVPLVIARRAGGGLIERWEQRFEAGKARYAALETYTLIGPRSSAKLRFCTSELKTHVIEREIRRMLPGEQVISVIGLRREESSARAKTPIAKASERGGVSWHPLVEWSAEAVFALHRREELPLHEAYTVWNATRMGCTYCVLACEHNLRASTRAPANLDTYRHLVRMEATSTFSFQPARWLGEISPELLTPALSRQLVDGQRAAAMRRALEDTLPAGLRYTKGWPPRVPTLDEAATIARVRTKLLSQHRLESPYRTAHAVRERFAELHHLKHPEMAA